MTQHLQPRQRVILLGASNLIRGLPTALATCQQLLEGPLDFLVAAGHGRSYGQTSTFCIVRSLPAILECGLWERFAVGEKIGNDLPSYALISDIGNDLLHGCLPEEIVSWLRSCLERLLERQARVVISQLPMASLDKLGRFKFGLLRRITYPRSTLQYEEALARIDQLQEAVLRLADSYGVPTVAPQEDWYGFDPIHVRWRDYPRAWRRIMATWGESSRRPVALPAFSHWLRLQCLHPFKRSLFGVERCRKQPAMIDSDGSTISIF